MSRTRNQHAPVHDPDMAFAPDKTACRLLHHFVRRKTAWTLAAALACAFPAAVTGASLVNDARLTSTFGDGADNVDLLNRGTITTRGTGMNAGENAFVENAGTIDVTGPDARGMSGQDGAILVNDRTASITTAQSQGDGIVLSGNTGHLANNGAIVSNGPYSAGLHARDTGDLVKNVTLTNNGTIRMEAGSGVGIAADAHGARVTNGQTGSIVTNAAQDAGIVAAGDNIHVVNDGTIVVNGDNSFGIAAYGRASALINNGTITVNGNGSVALQAGRNATVTQTGDLLATGKDNTGILINDSSTLVQSGTVTTTASGSDGIDGNGNGIHVENTRLIQTGGDRSNGIHVVGDHNRIDQSGQIDTTGDTSYGISAQGNRHILVNQGSVTASGAAGGAVFLSGNDNTLDQSGTLHTTGVNSPAVTLAGNRVRFTQADTGTVETTGDNSPALVVTADDARLENRGLVTTRGTGSPGMAVSGHGVTLVNSGTVTTTGDNSPGVTVSGHRAHVTNEGTIETTGLASSAIRADSDITLVNDGSLTAKNGPVVRTGAETHLTNNGRVTADNGNGIQVQGGNGIIVNNGAITVSGDAGHAVDATGDHTALFNNGLVRTSGASGDGIVVSGQGLSVINNASVTTLGPAAHGIVVTDGNAVVTNTGRIFTLGPGSHELMAGSADQVARVSVTEWSLAINPVRWSDPANRPFGVDPGSTLHFDHTRLILRPGGAGSGFAFDTRYNVADMIDNHGTISGAIGSDVPDDSVKGALPMLHAKLYNGTVPGALHQQVSLNLREEDSHGQQANSGIVHRTASRLWLLNRTLGGSLDTLVAASDWTLFVQPYYQNTRVTGNAKSRTDSGGLLMGMTRHIGRQARFGWHAGFEHADLSAGRYGLHARSNAGLAGLHGRYTFQSGFYLQGHLTATASHSDYLFEMERDSAGDHRTEYGFFAATKIGHAIRLVAENRLVPEIGLAGLWMRNPAMNAVWGKHHNQELNLQFERRDFSALYATADLRWYNQFTCNDTTFRPTVALGVRQNLLDGHVDAAFDFMNRRYTSYLTEDRTIGTVDAGIRFTRNTTSGAIRYNGEFGPHFTDHIVWAEIGVTF